jgi:hypothetical protein
MKFSALRGLRGNARMWNASSARYDGECLDHMIIFNEDSLRRTLSSYFSYYHRSRLHLSLGKDSPDSRPVQSIGKITAFPEVGGLHHRYGRVA